MICLGINKFLLLHTLELIDYYHWAIPQILFVVVKAVVDLSGPSSYPQRPQNSCRGHQFTSKSPRNFICPKAWKHNDIHISDNFSPTKVLLHLKLHL